MLAGRASVFIMIYLRRRYGHFSGINRKVQLKYQPKGRPRHSSSDDGKSKMLQFSKRDNATLKNIQSD